MIHSTRKVSGVSPFRAATHPLIECCRGMASWLGVPLEGRALLLLFAGAGRHSYRERGLSMSWLGVPLVGDAPC